MEGTPGLEMVGLITATMAGMVMLAMAVMVEAITNNVPTMHCHDCAMPLDGRSWKQIIDAAECSRTLLSKIAQALNPQLEAGTT